MTESSGEAALSLDLHTQILAFTDLSKLAFIKTSVKTELV